VSVQEWNNYSVVKVYETLMHIYCDADHNVFYSCAPVMSCSCIKILNSSTRHIKTTRTTSQSLKFLILLMESAMTKKHLIR